VADVRRRRGRGHPGEPLTKDLTAAAWRTALDPHGNWIPQVLTAADRRLSEVRRHVPDAGGLVIASDHAAARAYAARLRAITGEAPAVVLSDDDGASDRIDRFAGSQERWMVAVRMVSEGVDVPRLSVGVYATSVSTPLFFAQAVGRFLRARRRGETASVFLPSVPVLLQHAAEMEVERDHALDRPLREDGFDPEAALLERAQRAESHRPSRTHRRSRRSRRRRASTGCSTTVASSAPRRRSARPRRRTSSGCPGCSNPAGGRAAAGPAGRAARGSQAPARAAGSPGSPENPATATPPVGRRACAPS
jgi:superfamily II DNA or RNA helicase